MYIFCVYIYVCACSVTSVMTHSLQSQGLYPARLPCPWDFASKNTGVGCHALPQGIFPMQGLKLSPASPTVQADSLLLSHQGSPHICVYTHNTYAVYI